MCLCTNYKTSNILKMTLCLPINFYIFVIAYMETHGNIDESEQRIYVKYRTILESPIEEIQNDLVKIHGDSAVKLMREQNNDPETPSKELPEPEYKQGIEDGINSHDDVNTDDNQSLPVLVTKESTISTNDPDMDAITQHQRLSNTILRHKATVANKQRRMPSFRKTAAPNITIRNTNDFFDIQDFLEINPDFSKIKASASDEDLECKVRERRKDPLTEEMRNSKVLKRYSMPPTRSQSYRTPSYQTQPRVMPRALTENSDNSPNILRKSREIQRDESITSISENETVLPPKPILRSKPVLKNPEISDATQPNTANTEFIQRASRMRQSWDGQAGRRIEKLLNKTPPTNESTYKRHSMYISNGIAPLENKPKPPPPPGPKPKSPAKLVKIGNIPKAIIPDAPKGKESETKTDDNPKELQKELLEKIESTPSKVLEKDELQDGIKNEKAKEAKDEVVHSPKDSPEATIPAKPTPPFGYSKVNSLENNASLEDDSENIEKKVSSDPKQGERPKITRPKPTISRKPRVQKNSRAELAIVKAKAEKSSNIEKTVHKEDIIENREQDQKSEVINARIDKNSISSDDDQKKPNFNDNSHEINGTMNSNQDRESSSVLCNGQNSNNSNCSSINKNNRTQTNNSSFIKEKPIFAFLKAKEETNQQSFNKGSQMNRAFLSSGIPTSGIQAKDKDNFNSKPIIPQPKIITY